MKHLKHFLFACFLLFGTVTLSAYGRVAATPEPEKKNLEEKYEELEELEKKEQKYRDIIDLKKKEQDVIAAQINRIDSETAKIEQTIKQNESDITTLEHEIGRIENEIVQKEQLIAVQKAVLARFLRERYQDSAANAVQQSALMRLLHSGAAAHDDYLAHASTSLSEHMMSIHAAQMALHNDRDELKNKTQSLQDTKYQLEQRSEHLESSRNYKSVLAAQVALDESKYQDRLDKVLQEQLAIQQEISNLGTTQIDNFSLADLPNRKKANFGMPVEKPYVLTQGYGKTSFSSHYKGGLHNGIDYAARGGNLGILAAADGTVKATGDMGKYGYGRWVVIDHNNGLITLYGHLSSVKASRGKKVKKGDKIGVMGNTGFSTGRHLHFSVFAAKTFRIVESSTVKNVYIPTGATVNPALYL